MPRCPKCSYMLVLLEKRTKYKCAKCSRLYPQSEIDNKEFRDWNRDEQKKDEKQWDTNHPIRSRKTRVHKSEKQSSLQKFLATALRKTPEGLKQYNQDKNKQLYYANLEHSRILRRIRYWRQEQKKLMTQLVIDL